MLQTHKNLRQKLIHKLHQCLNKNVDIYNQAVLKQETPLIEIAHLEKNNEKELTILFQLKGEFEGQIICTINLSDLEIRPTHYQMLQSLFTESMNILLGQFLTEIENDIGVMSLLSAPEIILKDRKINLLTEYYSTYTLNLTTQYELHTLKETYPCQIYFLINTKAIKEV